jgi:hypothetical protein
MIWAREGDFAAFQECTEVQKTLFTAQQLCGDVSAWWANYAVTHLADY